ncbi:hypothetical protein, partial [Paraburkholderia domus]|uniref:hypothetical protein n=1 Tax=Paraburkholderia domus TaxID=2793075 RepID=UPI001BACDD26
DECVFLLWCQVLDVRHLRHVLNYAQPGSSLQALNSYAPNLNSEFNTQANDRCVDAVDVDWAKKVLIPTHVVFSRLIYERWDVYKDYA